MVDGEARQAAARRAGPSALTSIGRRSLAVEAYRQIRQALTTGELLPGQKLNIREIADSFGTSATPVREALVQLAGEGALELRAGHSFTVPVLTRSTYLELRDLRLNLEGLGAARAAELASPSAIDKLDGLHAKLVAAKARKDFKAALRWNESFHLALCREAAMPRLLRIVEGLWAQSGPLLNMLYATSRMPSAEDKVHGHLRVIEALRRRDGAAARAGIEDDIAGGTSELLAHLKD
ncbi:HTH-type transcriptional regulator McbR [bacterium YEK0313]|nr:HTH-type transcriptional regulator McbR [bacterium YEK0313]